MPAARPEYHYPPLLAPDYDRPVLQTQNTPVKSKIWASFSTFPASGGWSAPDLHAVPSVDPPKNDHGEFLTRGVANGAVIHISTTPTAG